MDAIPPLSGQPTRHATSVCPLPGVPTRTHPRMNRFSLPAEIAAEKEGNARHGFTEPRSPYRATARAQLEKVLRLGTAVRPDRAAKQSGRPLAARPGPQELHPADRYRWPLALRQCCDALRAR